MRTIYLAGSLFFLCVCTWLPVRSQAPQAPVVEDGLVFKANPLSLFALTLNGAVEMPLQDNMSVQGGLLVGGIPANANPRDGALRWWGATSEFRYYPQRQGLNGYYLAGYLRYRRVRGTYTGPVQDPDFQTIQPAEGKQYINDLGGGALLGRHWIFDNAFSLDLFAGPQFTSASVRTSIACPNCNGNERLVESLLPVDLGGLGIRAGINLGWYFAG